MATDDQGRYVMPELPSATYSVWVRGYGLVDSPRVTATPGKILDLRAVVAPTAAAAAEYYPAIYWYSMLKIPERGQFPLAGTGRARLKIQGEWLNVVKTNGCMSCHALGTKATRTMPAEYAHFKPSTEAWARRITAGQAMTQMLNAVNRLDSPRALGLWADWTDRIAAGELPFATPPRPQGVERNVVMTLWDWSNPKAYLHDEISTDRRNPTVNAYGKLYGSAEESTDLVPVLDPVRHTAVEVKHPVRDPSTPSSKANPMGPSPYWGDERIWDSQTSNHNPMLDEKGRVWFTTRVRPPDNPAFCRKGSEPSVGEGLPDGPLHPAAVHVRPGDGQVHADQHVLPHAPPDLRRGRRHTLWTSSGGAGNQVLGWLEPDAVRPDRRRGAGAGLDAVRPRHQRQRPARRVRRAHRADRSGEGQAGRDRHLRRLGEPGRRVGLGDRAGLPGLRRAGAPGPNPTETAIAEIYEPPFPGYGVRGGDIDRNGVFWVSLASGHLGSFDRSRCKGPLNGPGAATGRHCPEGWTLHPFPGPQFRDVPDTGSAEASYYTWVDQFDTFGLGRNVPIATGNMNDALLALVDGKFVVLRVPYPIGYFTKWMDGRIDDPNGGWKGKGLWSTYSTRTMFHLEGGKENRPRVVRFQLRPDPLAR